MRDSDMVPTVPFPPARQGPGVPLRFALAVLAGLALIAALRLAGMPGKAQGWAVSAGLFLLIGMIVAAQLRRSYPHSRLGACNVVTLMRIAMTCAMVPPVLAHATGGAAIALLACAALLLDGLDGWLARRSGLSSDFGARFDIEADAGFALVLTMHALVNGAGAEVLALGVTRYVFVAAGWVWPWLAAPLAPSLRRKAVCLFQLAVLISLQFLPLDSPRADLLIWAAIIALFWSFGVDMLRLWRERP